MPDSAKVVINLATGLEDAERVTVAFLVGDAFADGGGELLVCPICFNTRKLDEGSLVANARLAGATPLWEWIADEHATVFSY